MEDLKTWIKNELPTEGVWWSDGYTVFNDSAEKMFNSGMEVSIIKEILSDCYNAVKGEFGS